jgi:hypothetical protein
MNFTPLPNSLDDFEIWIPSIYGTEMKCLTPWPGTDNLVLERWFAEYRTQ